VVISQDPVDLFSSQDSMGQEEGAKLVSGKGVEPKDMQTIPTCEVPSPKEKK
jgi:hypothetical protein